MLNYSANFSRFQLIFLGFNFVRDLEKGEKKLTCLEIGYYFIFVFLFFLWQLERCNSMMNLVSAIVKIL